MKEVKNIVKISKSEMEYLVKNGVKFGENGLVKTKSHHRKSYFVAETQKCMNLLSEIRDDKVIPNC